MIDIRRQQTSEERSDVFVSRRGKQTNVHEAEAVAVSRKPEAVPPQPHRAKPTRRGWKVSHKAIVIAGIALLLGGLSVLVMADSVKRDYERQEMALRRSVHEAGKNIPSNDITAAKAAEMQLQKLSASDKCRAQGIDIASWYGPAKSAREKCQSAAVGYRTLRATLTDMQVASLYLGRAAEALRPALRGDGDGYAVADTYAAAWKNAADQLRNLTPPPAFTASHASLITRTNAMSETWQRMAGASREQNAEVFKSAEADLQKQYIDYRAEAGAMNHELVSLQKKINDAVAQLPLDP